MREINEVAGEACCLHFGRGLDGAMAGHEHQIVALWACAVLLLHLVQHTLGQNLSLEQVYNFSDSDLYGLEQLYAEWIKKTPDKAKNLAGWTDISNHNFSSENSPCYGTSESWQGLLCIRQLLPPPGAGFYYELYAVSIVGLTFTDTLLEGSLPPAIGNFTVLASLTLTGNKQLTGPLPSELQFLRLNLNSLNLQGNGFNGSIPTTLGSLGHQLYLIDLSENQFDGPLQVNFSDLIGLRTLNLSRNLLSGNIPNEYLQNLEQLISLDLSSNNFTGHIFNLSTSSFLNSLNLSYNSFRGDISLSNILNLTSSVNLNEVDLSNNLLTGLLPDFSAWTNLTLLDLSNNKFQASLLPVWIKNLTELQVLRLKGNNLFGQIPNDFLQDFKQLQILALDNNHFNGMLDIGNIMELPMLSMLSITNNNISNVLYNGLPYNDTLKKFGINLNGNPYCSQISQQNYLQQCFCLQICMNQEIIRAASRSARAIIIATSVAASSLAIAILIISLIFWKTRQEKRNLQLQVQQHFAEKDIKPTIFTFTQLRNATEEFSETNKIGQGSFGAVYKGYLHGNAEPVAVKQLFIRNQQSITDFLNEVVVVTAIKHRNLVNLKGCCVREDQRILVYEYLDNNDLEHHLFNRRGNQHLPWPARFNICLGVARGLHYLHESAQPRIIHRDIKASNILMDHNLQPKIADFGLALFFPDEQSHIITRDIAGTRGYWAPEYATMGKLSEKADVYSFGILLLEIVSGRKNLDYTMPQHKTYLNEWAKELHNESNVMELVDPALFLSKDEELEVRRIINIALLCIQVEPERRPTMGAIEATLEGTLNLEAEGMQHLNEVKEPLTWAHFELHPLRNDAGSQMFSSEATGSSSMISLTSMGNYSRSASVSHKMSGTSMGAPCGGTIGSSMLTRLAR